MQSVQDGTSYGVISIGQNFSVSLFRRYVSSGYIVYKQPTILQIDIH